MPLQPLSSRPALALTSTHCARRPSLLVSLDQIRRQVGETALRLDCYLVGRRDGPRSRRSLQWTRFCHRPAQRLRHRDVEAGLEVGDHHAGLR